MSKILVVLMGLLFLDVGYASTQSCEQYCSSMGIARDDRAILNHCVNQSFQQKLCGQPIGACGGSCGDGREMGWQNGKCICIDEGRSSANEQQGVTCRNTFENLVASCQQSVLPAQNSCDETQDGGMVGVTDSMSNMALMLGQQAASSIQAACSKMANVSQAANAALAAYRINCSSSINSCTSTCQSAKSYYEANHACITSASVGSSTPVSIYVQSIDSSIHSCTSLNAKSDQANQAIQNFMNTSATATQCASLTSGTGDLTAFCTANPTSPLCENQKIDCSHPSMASNKVCICQINPTSTDCLTTKTVNPSAPPNYTGGSSDYSSRTPSGDSMDFGDVPNLPEIAMGNSPGNGGGSSLDGNQGSGAGLGGGGGGNGGGAGGGEGEGGGGSGTSTDINAGFYGGGGATGGSYGGARGGGGRGGYGGGANGAAGNPQSPDLRQFLPSGANDPRRRAMGLSGQDGITGPHSNIWKKIQNRYQVMRPSLLP